MSLPKTNIVKDRVTSDEIPSSTKSLREIAKVMELKKKNKNIHLSPERLPLEKVTS